LPAAPYTLRDFAASLRLEDCKIQNAPDLLFLCGGPMDAKGPYHSARDFFYRHLKRKKHDLAGRVRLAEDVNAWFQKAWFRNESAFSDLVDVENYLAHLAAVTVLFVESPGSIAELGAFSASDHLHHKILAVINEFHGSDDSFISDGPVRKLFNHDSSRILYDSWNPKEPNSVEARRAFSRVAKDLVSSLEALDATRPKQPDFKRDTVGHTLLLVADLIWLQGAVSRSEVVEVLGAVGCESSLETVSRHLSILQSVGLADRRKRHVETFYVPVLAEPFIRYAYTKDAKLKEAVKIQHAIRQALEPRRKSIVASMLKATPHV
jgi:DNA-binding transcriptional ArsR family regulator